MHDIQHQAALDIEHAVIVHGLYIDTVYNAHQSAGMDNTKFPFKNGIINQKCSVLLLATGAWKRNDFSRIQNTFWI